MKTRVPMNASKKPESSRVRAMYTFSKAIHVEMKTSGFTIGAASMKAIAA